MKQIVKIHILFIFMSLNLVPCYPIRPRILLRYIDILYFKIVDHFIVYVVIDFK